jgi:Putative peptidoglycan binding domain
MRGQKFWSAASIFLSAVIGISGCSRNQPVQKRAPVRAAEAPPPVLTVTEPKPVNERGSTESRPLEGSGITVWAKEFPGEMIAGLDGAVYEPYGRRTVELVQTALKDRGLYAGPVNGILDRPTMESIYTFQKATHNLQRCGVPTPNTRRLLVQGSHTDLPS